MALTDEDVREILRIIDESQVDELRLERDGVSLYVARAGAQQTAAPTATATAVAPAPAAPAPTPAPPPDPPATAPAAEGLVTIEAPMLGTFYRAEAPGRDPFVDVGSHVEPDTVVAIIEVMKMMNSVEAGVAGTIAEVCADNATLVEYGQPLFRVEPDAA
jgi:acetyl-CoA carboxylase biotin carboxyl carrier protein